MTAATNYQRLVERLADTGQPLELNAHDLATVLAHEPTLLIAAASKTVVTESVVRILQEDPDLTIATAACIGGAITGALKAQVRRHVTDDVRLELRRRRFGGEPANRSMH